jgi:hypothetical protein
MVRKYQLFSLAVPIRCGLMDFLHNGPIPSWLNHALTPLSTLPPLRKASLLRLRSVAVTHCAIAAFTVRPSHALNSGVNRRAPGKWWCGPRSGARPHLSQRWPSSISSGRGRSAAGRFSTGRRYAWCNSPRAVNRMTGQEPPAWEKDPLSTFLADAEFNTRVTAITGSRRVT